MVVVVCQVVHGRLFRMAGTTRSYGNERASTCAGAPAHRCGERPNDRTHGLEVDPAGGHSPYYAITPAGRRRLDALRLDWEAFTTATTAIINGKEGTP